MNKKDVELFSVYTNNDNDDDYNTSILYQLLFERNLDKSISHIEMPTFELHKEFVKSDPYKHWYLIYDYNLKHLVVGSIYLSKNNEIGLFIFDKYKRQGYGSSALNTFIDTICKDEKVLYANINPNNQESIDFFTKRFNFTHIQNTYRLYSLV